jgi:hypothetical protein
MDRRVVAGIVALIVLGTILAGVIMLRAPTPAGPPVYAASAVARDLRYHPKHWMGRTVLVRGAILPLGWIRPLHSRGPGQLAEEVAWQNAPPSDTFPSGSIGEVSLGSRSGVFDPATTLLLCVQEHSEQGRLRELLRHMPFVASMLGPGLVLPMNGVYRVHLASPLHWVYSQQVPDGVLLVP